MSVHPMSLKATRKFIKGPFAGTNLEIMPSKAAVTLPDGTPIWVRGDLMEPGGVRLNETQKAHLRGEVDVHEPQVFNILDESDKTVYRYEGPSIAQEWKILFRGERPFYRNMGRA